MERSAPRAEQKVAIVGAGVGGLVAAVELALQGVEVVVLEQAAAPGGKLRALPIGDARVDAGPTVFTMRWIFDEIFAAAGTSLDAHLDLRPAGILARHAWPAGERLDLHADLERSAAAIGAFAGPGEARRYREFSDRARRIYDTLERPYLLSPRGGPLALVRRTGVRRLGDLWHIAPFSTLWRALGEHFHDPRLRQLFGRYSTYCGSSPFLAPATLMLIAHVEREGVWLVDGGMHRIAEALAALAARAGATFRYGAAVKEIAVGHGRVAGVTLASGERIEATTVVVNADVAAIATGRLGAAVAGAVPNPSRRARSLSAITWSLVARTEGFPLVRHNVFFSADYEAEFAALVGRRCLPPMPTVYVCAQDRADGDVAVTGRAERLLCLVNAPPTGDSRVYDRGDIERSEARAFGVLARAGLAIDRRREATVVTTPTDFERLYPATGGALYGAASHGWRASFRRCGAKTRVPGLYCAGGSVHPGPGVPMAALSGRLAAAAVLADRR